jgi:hypothetical protein
MNNVTKHNEKDLLLGFSPCCSRRDSTVMDVVIVIARVGPSPNLLCKTVKEMLVESRTLGLSNTVSQLKFESSVQART